MVALFFTTGYALYLLLLPQKWNNSLANRIITFASFYLVVLIVMFSFFAELAFWDEFESRFNFIAVDYLIYTFEVINNINQSYPLPWLISSMVLLTSLVFFIFYKKKIFLQSFQSDTPFKKRFLITCLVLAPTLAGYFFVSNSWADNSNNRYQSELAKAGIFSFFAAFKNNELNYYDFYAKEKESEAFAIAQKQLQEPLTRFVDGSSSLRRIVTTPGQTIRPNVILVTIESLSADYMHHFGNNQHITPILDSLADHALLFTNMYATGTRTVRGMEALSLCVPPTPGNSIVRRKDNAHLYTVGSIFRKAGYSTTFFYGGDGFFDNMNNFFGNNGFDITDNGERLLPNERLTTNRTTIPAQTIHFKNAWGICDEDLYDAVIRHADAQYSHQQPFFDFVMTTSNHRPFTYPSGKIDIPSGSGREGAVKYTDYAIGEFLKKIQSKPWFDNTVIIFVADHCSSSAGRNEINVSKYHIPCLVYNLKNDSLKTISQQCSQIDLFPTLFGLLHWQYETIWYGQNVLLPTYQSRAWVATYQKLGYLQHDSLAVLSPQQQVGIFKWDKQSDDLQPIHTDSLLIKKAIATYQTAYYLYKTGGMKE
ncbi:LTA synthase family protein [Chitinophaga sp.]|uniref:LTA synthase family protein n=1 Tax=Chitinophaga sp. TaxID=1869181 RepID=UPI0031D959FE